MQHEFAWALPDHNLFGQHVLWRSIVHSPDKLHDLLKKHRWAKLSANQLFSHSFFNYKELISSTWSLKFLIDSIDNFGMFILHVHIAIKTKSHHTDIEDDKNWQTIKRDRREKRERQKPKQIPKDRKKHSKNTLWRLLLFPLRGYWKNYKEARKEKFKLNGSFIAWLLGWRYS